MLLTNITNFKIIPDRTHQGVLNHLMMTKVIAGDFSNDPAVFGADGKSTIDPTKKSYCM